MAPDPDPTPPPRRRILAVASGGGHWVQLLRLRPAFAGCTVRYATTDHGFARDVGEDILWVPDANMDNKLGLLRMAWRMLVLVVWLHPHVIITTGAAPGYFAIMWGRLLGRRTIWVDSVANAEELSKSGRQAGRWADAWLTQWPQLARPEGPACWGNVL
jgi:hypothetical protein